MKTKLGSDLTPLEKKIVLARFVHRFTVEHVPAWAKEEGTNYRIQFSSDADWLEHTEFVVTKSGKLDRRAKQCFSCPTWPSLGGCRLSVGK